MTRRVSFWVPTAALTSSLGGCSLAPDPKPPTPSKPFIRPLKPSAEAAATKNKSTASPWSLWTQAWSRMAQGEKEGATSSKTLSSKGASPKRDAGSSARGFSNDDVLALARRHPAWLLADALERSRMTNSNSNNRFALNNRLAAFADANFTDVGDARRFGFSMPRFAPDDFRGANDSGFSSPLSSSGMSTHAEAKLFLSDRFPLPAQRQTARLAQWESDVRTRREKALDTFLATAALEQRALRRAREDDLSMALMDDVEMARRVPFSFADPALPSDPIQLEMTNLRLRLLENAPSTIAEKQRARARLAVLEARWRQKLEATQQASRNEFTEERDAAPLRVRDAGEARIVAALDQIRAEDTARRGAARASYAQRLETDFSAPNNDALGIVSPAVSFDSAFGNATVQEVRATNGAFESKAARRGNFGQGKTFVSSPSSNPPSSKRRLSRAAISIPLSPAPSFPLSGRLDAASDGSVNRGDIDAQIRALRQKALRESAQWARMASRSASRTGR